MIRPAMGELVLLVYRECMCGRSCFTGEGECAPICAGCGRRMMPASGPAFDRVADGRGVLGFFGNEIELAQRNGKLHKNVKALRALRRLLFARKVEVDRCVDEGPWHGPGPERYYAPEGIAADLRERGFPTEKVWGPLTASPDLDDPTDEEEGGPPWEREGQTAKGRERRGRRAA